MTAVAYTWTCGVTVEPWQAEPTREGMSFLPLADVVRAWPHPKGNGHGPRGMKNCGKTTCAACQTTKPALPFAPKYATIESMFRPLTDVQYIQRMKMRDGSTMDRGSLRWLTRPLVVWDMTDAQRKAGLNREYRRLSGHPDSEEEN